MNIVDLYRKRARQNLILAIENLSGMLASYRRVLSAMRQDDPQRPLYEEAAKDAQIKYDEKLKEARHAQD